MNDQGDRSTSSTTILTTKRAADLLGVSESFIKRECRNGRLNGFKVGKVWRISMEALEEYIAVCRKNQGGKSCVSPATRNRMKFHATLRSKAASPKILERMQQSIAKIKGELPALDQEAKIPSVAKLRATVISREEKTRKLAAIPHELEELATKAYPEVKDLVNQDPEALEAIFTEHAQAGQPLKVMKADEAE